MLVVWIEGESVQSEVLVLFLFVCFGEVFLNS